MKHERRVQRGAAWLDEHRPGWEWNVDLDKLDMRYDHTCVFAQALNVYFDRRLAKFYGIGHRKAVSFGILLTPVPRTYASFERRTAELAATWRVEIRRRRTAVAVPVDQEYVLVA